MKDNKVTVLTLLFFLLCASLIGGVWFLDKRVRDLQEQYDEVEQRRVDLNGARGQLDRAAERTLQGQRQREECAAGARRGRRNRGGHRRRQQQQEVGPCSQLGARR